MFFNETELSNALPNLDGYTDPNELNLFRIECKAVQKALKNLSSYAEAKQGAIELRLRGDIRRAQLFDTAADTIYARLPEWAKW